MRVIAEIGMRVIQERNGSNVPTVSYTRGTDLSGSLEGAGGIGGLLGRSHGYNTGSGNWSAHNYYHADGNGNITYLETAAQGLAAKYRYDAYGNTVSSSGAYANINVYRFSSKEYHALSGLYYYGYRWYDPYTQRWLNRDPIFEAGGFNLYSFVHNEPTLYVDMDGRDWWPPSEWPIVRLLKPAKEYWDSVKEMTNRIKEAMDDYENGKCPVDPCKVPSSLNATCTCMYEAAKAGDLEGMAKCVCQASPNSECERKAKKIFAEVFGL